MKSVKGKTKLGSIVLCEIPEFRLGSASRTSSSQHIIIYQYHEDDSSLLVSEELIGNTSIAVAQAVARGESLTGAQMTADVGFDFVAPEEEETEEEGVKKSKKDKKNHRAAVANVEIDFDTL